MTGEELREALAQRGLTQKVFARKYGYRRETVSRWINGHTEIPLVVVGLLAAWRETDAAQISRRGAHARTA